MVEYIIKIVLNRKNSIQGVFKKLKVKKKIVINYLLLDYKPLNKVFNSGLQSELFPTKKKLFDFFENYRSNLI